MAAADSRSRRPRAQRWPRDPRAAAVAGAILTAAIAAVDAALAAQHVVITGVLLGPIVAVLRATERQVALIGLLAVALGIISGAWNDEFGDDRHIFRVGVIAAGVVAATLAARFREREEVALLRMGMLAHIGEVADGTLTRSQTAERIVQLLVPGLADGAAIGIGLGDEEARIAGAGSLEGASTMEVPLASRGRRLGTLILHRGPGRQPFRDDDREFARTAAGRASLALDNAGLSLELMTLERQLVAALANLAEAVTVQDARGGLIFANRAAARLMGFEESDDVLTRPTSAIVAEFDVFREDGTPLPIEELPGRRVLAGEDPDPVLLRARNRATGEERWRYVKASGVRDAEGRIQFAVNVIEDVTDARRAEMSQRLLAEASRKLSASLELEETLDAVATAVVPEFADWCIVHVPGDAGDIRLVGVAHADPEKVASARDTWERNPARMDDGGVLAQVLAGAPAVLVPVITDEMLVAAARDEGHLASLRDAGMRSTIIVPMRTAGRTLGTITLVSAESAHVYAPADLEVAEELGRRAAVAVENARLYQEQLAVATALQEDLLPAPLPEMPGWRTATIYRPASEGADVGGDFLDGFELGDGWALVVGDVAGRGPAAASLTAMARYTLRTAAALTGDAAEAVRLLNRALSERPRMALVSVCVAHVHGGDRTGVISVICAGHPPPVAVRSGGAEPVGVAGPVLGAVDDGSWAAVEVALEPGEQLVMYTDGVIDASGANGRFGEVRLRQVLAGAREADDAVQRVLSALSVFEEADDRRDDTAVLALSREPVVSEGVATPAGGQRHHMRLESDPAAAGEARRAVAAWLDGALTADRMNEMRLLVSEVVTNGVRHASRRDRDAIEIEVTVLADHVRVEVTDPGPGFEPPPPEPPPPDAIGGRGLLIVDRVASRWGVEGGDRFCVWFELPRA